MNQYSVKKFFSLLIFWSVGSGCATYQHRIQDGIEKLKSNQVEEAVNHFKVLADKSKDSKDELAYLLDYATALQIAGRYQESAQMFIKADRLNDQLDYISVTQVAGATLGGEESIAYKAESYEKLMINGMNALNFLAINDLESAMVEVRRIDHKIKILQRDVRPDYQFNPFATYLAGLIYEAQGQWDDAFLEYLRTYRLGLKKEILVTDLHRAALQAQRVEQLKSEGIWDELLAKDLKKNDCWLKKQCGMATFIFLRGLGPQKLPLREDPRIPGLYPRKNQVRYFKIKLTPSVTRIPALSFMPQGVDLTREMVGEEIYNVTQVAIETLLADRAALKARRFGAQVAKHVVASRIEEKHKGLGSIALLLMMLSDRADLRQWALLPDAIDLAKVPLPPGDWLWQGEGVDELQQSVISFPGNTIQVKPNKMIFKILRTYK
ncbi:MAG: hypothetical protein NZ480_00170 [Bdellovibrionaceae bacterium]|nr:hypothetical protein [Pseudobdellovibrionaceae bacterium]MDW8190425.1 hypothetical protein [Pseudobdellovibrionaceae bacterium]